WPMGFIIIAKGAQSLFFWSELAWTTVYVALAWVCVTVFALNGAGIAFFGSYIFHVLMIYLIVRRLSGFEWSSENIRVGLLFILFVGLVFGSFVELPDVLAMAVGIFALIASSVYSIRSLLKKIPLNHIPRPVLRLL